MITALALSTLIQTNQSAPTNKIWLMFFVKGKVEAPQEKDKVQKMMSGHLSNFESLANGGKLVAAGPINDPTGKLRGITVLEAKSLEEIKGYFKNDPFIKAGVMTVEAEPWSVKKSSFRSDYDAENIVEHRLVLFSKGKTKIAVIPEMVNKHNETMKAIIKANKVGIYGAISGNRVGALIVEGSNTESIEKAIKESILIKNGAYSYEIFRLWMSKGVLGR